jgi:AraC-like DNA-binding protein
MHHFQMGFVPHIITRAVFNAPRDFQTFDIHFDLVFLQEIGLDYKSLDRFINHVLKDQPAELSLRPHPCSPLMLENVYGILQNSYTAPGKAHLLRNNVTNILIAALEIVGKHELDRVELSASDTEALHHVKQLIEANVPDYLGNDVLVAKAYPRLNAFKLNVGFKQLFGSRPYDYYLQLRFLMAKELLRQNNSVAAVAYELGYESPTTFIKEFKKRFGMTPKEWQVRRD